METDPNSPDLDAVAQDLADVEKALDRLQSGTYWTDEATGGSLDADLLSREPLARQNPR